MKYIRKTAAFILALCACLGCLLLMPAQTHASEIIASGECGTEGAALGHTWDGGVVTMEPTESAEGVKIFICTACAETKTEAIPIVKHTHKHEAAVTVSTCTEKGYTTYTCACGTTEGEVLAHSFEGGKCTVFGTVDESYEPNVGLLGDADSNGKVNNIDAMLVLQYFAGLAKEDKVHVSVCDVNGDGKVNNIDAMIILQYFAGLIDRFPAEEETITDQTSESFMDACAPYEWSKRVYRYTDESIFSMSGESYSDGVTMEVYEGGAWFLSNLKGAYSELQFHIGHVDRSGMTDCKVSVYLDGVLYETFDVASAGLPQHITVPVTGVKQLKVKATYDKYGSGYATVGLGNMTILPNADYVPDTQSPDANAESFMDACAPYEWSKRVYGYTDESVFSMSGEYYSDGVTMEVYEGGAWFLSNLKGAYSELHFYVGHVDRSGMTDCKISVYLDGVLYETYDVPCERLSQLITVPVTGVKQIKVMATYDKYGSGYATIGLGNMTVFPDTGYVPNVEKQLTSVIAYQDGEKTEEYHLIYNDLGQAVGLTAYLHDNGDTTTWYGQKYEYDDRGNLTLKVHGHTQSWHYEYEYDLDGRISEYNVVEMYDGSAVFSDAYSLTYDDQARLVKREKIQGGGSLVQEFSYDESGKVVYMFEDLYYADGHFVKTATYDCTHAPLIIRAYASKSEEYGNSSGKIIDLIPHWNLKIVSFAIDDECTFEIDSKGYLIRVVDEKGENVVVCNYEKKD